MHYDTQPAALQKKQGELLYNCFYCVILVLYHCASEDISMECKDLPLRDAPEGSNSEMYYLSR